MLQNSGVELNKEQSFDAVKCYGKLVNGSAGEPEKKVDESHGPDVTEKKPEKDLPGKASSQPASTTSQPAKIRKKSPSGHSAKQESSKSAELKSGKQAGWKDVGTQESLFAATIFREDYHSL